jgi:hypothetical protein
MPIEYRIDHDRKLVLAKGRGTVTDQDVLDANAICGRATMRQDMTS